MCVWSPSKNSSNILWHVLHRHCLQPFNIRDGECSAFYNAKHNSLFRCIRMSPSTIKRPHDVTGSQRPFSFLCLLVMRLIQPATVYSRTAFSSTPFFLVFSSCCLLLRSKQPATCSLEPCKSVPRSQSYDCEYCDVQCFVPASNSSSTTNLS